MALIISLIFSAIAVDNLVKAASNVLNYPIPWIATLVRTVFGRFDHYPIEIANAEELIKNGNEGIWTLVLWPIVSVAIYFLINRLKKLLKMDWLILIMINMQLTIKCNKIDILPKWLLLWYKSLCFSYSFLLKSL